jgi:DegV family protein with EDD domain
MGEAGAGRVRVVTATSTCLAPADARRHGITLVPLRVRVGGRDYRDVIDLEPAELYRLLRRRVVPTTSAPTIGDYVAAFESAGGPVLCLTVGGGVSAMDQAARLAAEAEAPGGSRRPVEVVETGTAAGGLRLAALAAARLAAGGVPLPELAARVRRLCERIEMAGMLESVEFLARGGRVPGVAHWGASVLRVRPVIRFQAGRGSLVRLVRGPATGLAELRRLVRDGARRQGAGAAGERLVCTVFQGDAEGLAAELAGRLREELPAADLSVSEMTAAMAVHVGPGTVGVALYVEAWIAY